MKERKGDKNVNKTNKEKESDYRKEKEKYRKKRI